jgi:hypothetical protein
MTARPCPRRSLSRRSFLAASLAAGGAALAPGADSTVRRRGIRLGFDNFAVRALKWNARQLVDHAESLACDSVFITDFGPFEGRTTSRHLTPASSRQQPSPGPRS